VFPLPADFHDVAALAIVPTMSIRTFRISKRSPRRPIVFQVTADSDAMRKTAP